MTTVVTVVRAGKQAKQAGSQPGAGMQGEQAARLHGESCERKGGG